jgi:hypothetical protein
MMIIVSKSTINFYYLAPTIDYPTMVVSHYTSEKYLFAVAHNVGFLKRFAGL